MNLLLFVITYLRVAKQLQVVADEEIQVINLKDLIPNYQRNISYNIVDQPSYASIYQNRIVLDQQSINLEDLQGVSSAKVVLQQETGFSRNIYYLVFKTFLFESIRYVYQYISSQGTEMGKFNQIAEFQGVTDCYDIDFIYNKDQYSILIDCILKKDKDTPLENKFIIYSNGQQTLYDSENGLQYKNVTKRSIFYDQIYNRIYRIYLEEYHDKQKNSIVELYEVSNDKFEYYGYIENIFIFQAHFNQRLFILSSLINIYEPSLDLILINSKNINVVDCFQFDVWPEKDRLVCVGNNKLTYTSISNQGQQKVLNIPYSLEQVFILKDFLVVRVEQQILFIDIEKFQILPWKIKDDSLLYIQVDRQLNQIITYSNSTKLIQRILLLQDQYLEIRYNDSIKQSTGLNIISQNQQINIIEIQFANYDSHQIYYENVQLISEYIYIQDQSINLNRKYYGPALNFSIQPTQIFTELKYKEKQEINGFPTNPIGQIKMISIDDQNQDYFYLIQKQSNNQVHYQKCDLQPINNDFNQMCGKSVQINNFFNYDISTMWYQNFTFRIVEKQNNTLTIIQYSQNTSKVESIFQQSFDQIIDWKNNQEKIYVLTSTGVLGYSSQSNYTQLLFNFTAKDFEAINIQFKDIKKLVISKNPCQYFFLQSELNIYQFFRVGTKLVCTSQITISSINTNIDVYGLDKMFIILCIFQNGYLNGQIYRNYEYIRAQFQGNLPFYNLKAIKYDLWPDTNQRFILRSFYGNVQTLSQYDMSKILYSSLLQKFDIEFSEQFYYYQSLIYYNVQGKSHFQEIRFADQARLITNMSIVQNQTISDLNMTVVTTLKEPKNITSITERIISVNSQIYLTAKGLKIKLKQQNIKCIKLERHYFSGTVSQYVNLSNHQIKPQFQPLAQATFEKMIDFQTYNYEAFILLSNGTLRIWDFSKLVLNFSTNSTNNKFIQIIPLTDEIQIIYIIYQGASQFFLNIFGRIKTEIVLLEYQISVINQPTEIQQVDLYILITGNRQIQIIDISGSKGALGFLQEAYFGYLMNETLYTISLFQNQLIINRFDMNDSYFQIIEQLRLEIQDIVKQINIYVPYERRVINIQFVNLDLSKQSINIYTLRIILIYDYGVHDLVLDLEFENQVQFNKLSLRQIHLVDLIAPFGDWFKLKTGLTTDYLYYEYFDPQSKLTQISFYNYPNQTNQSEKAMQPFTSQLMQLKNQQTKLMQQDNKIIFTNFNSQIIEFYQMNDASYVCPKPDNSQIKVLGYNYISVGTLIIDLELDKGQKIDFIFLRAPWIWIVVSILGSLIVVGLSIIGYKYYKNRQQREILIMD